MSVLVGLGLSAAIGLSWVPSLSAGPGAPAAPGVASGPVAGVVRVPGAEELAASVVALTAPEMEGRGSGTMGGNRAARYLADRLAESGSPGGDRHVLSWFAVRALRRRGRDVAQRIGPPPALALGRAGRHGSSLAGDAAGRMLVVGYGPGGVGDYAVWAARSRSRSTEVPVRVRRHPGSKLIAARRHVRRRS
jgi:hypothetical protein